MLSSTGKVDTAQCVTTKDYSDTKFLHKAGGTMTGQLECARPGTGNTYLFSVKAQALPEGGQVASCITGDGASRQATTPTAHSWHRLPMMWSPRVFWTPMVVVEGPTCWSITLPTMSPQLSRIKNSNSTLISTSTAGKLKLYHVVDPTDAEHVANQRYMWIPRFSGRKQGPTPCQRWSLRILLCTG